ncbi:MAG: hypothetical protein L6R38_004903 [Xanthoria sp. 2 TBL-2021]|nr:MAG: hypothetical protein L6R38_004903 [Xanthoria sp. 2 TBL-2021]
MERRTRRPQSPNPESPISLTKTNHQVLLRYDQIPTWHQDNEYILSGYRPESNSTYLCFASWAYLHNETANIFSHFIPSMVWLACQAIIARVLAIKYPDSTIGDRLIFAFFFLTASVCLGISATYHTLMNHSATVSNLWLRLDYVGIMILTLGDFVSGIYFVFYCEPTLQKVYWSMISTLSTTTIIILVNPSLQGPRYRTLRICTFVFTGLSGFAPLIHGIKRFGIARMIRSSGMPFYLLEGLLLIIGAFFYGTRFPESIFPGRFDIWGCSHQVFHLLVVLATAVHAWGIVDAFDYNYHFGRC